jgi:hypothetical protein
MWKNMVQPERPLVTPWSMRIACWITKATYTYEHAGAHASTRTHTHIHTHSFTHSLTHSLTL